MILFIVIGIIMVVVVLSTVMLRIISNQARLTHHQVSRIQAQYAAKAGVLYALDKLRRNDAGWTDPGVISMRMCKGCAINEDKLPPSIQYVDITVGALNSGSVSGTRKVSAKATYTYTP